MNKKLIMIILLIIIYSLSIWAQSYQDDPEYQKLLELQAQAAEFYENGEYDKVYELLEGNSGDALFLRYLSSKQLQTAKEYLALAEDNKGQEMFPEEFAAASEDLVSAETTYNAFEYEQSLEYSNKVIQECLKFKAVLYILAARDRIEEVDTFNGDETNPQEYLNATESLDMAETMFLDDEYEKSINYSKNVIFELENIEPEVLALVDTTPIDTTPIDTTPIDTTPIDTTPVDTTLVETQEPDKAVLPKYYIIRLIPGNRDCLNQIAGYEFIYNDPEKWQILWEANKGVLKDPDNPHLIHPGQILEIPAIGDEVREGTYIPE